MRTDDVEQNILDTLEDLSTSEDIKESVGNIMSYIYRVSLANTLTPQEVLSLIFLVDTTVHTQYTAMFEEYLLEFNINHPNGEDEDE